MYSKQMDEPYFELRLQRSFLEWCNTLKIGRTKLRTVVEQERANIMYGQLALMPSGFGTLEEVSKSEFNFFLGFKSWKNLYGKTDYKDFSRVQQFLDHVKNVWFCNEGDKERQEAGLQRYLSYLADIFCHPDQRTDKIPVLISSVGGAGKTSVLNTVLPGLFGAIHFEECTSMHAVDPRFNARSKFVIHKLIDEIGEKLCLKAMSTRKFLRLEHKGIDVVQFGVQDYYNLTVCCNVFKPVLDPCEKRRYVVCNCGTHLAAGTPEGDEHLNSLFQAIEHPDFSEDLAFYLLNYDQPFDPKFNPLQSGTKCQRNSTGTARPQSPSSVTPTTLPNET